MLGAVSRLPLVALFVTCGLPALAPSRAAAEVRFADVFGDHMVLQREQPLPVWGYATAGDKVRVSLGGQSAEATADASGKWRVTLEPEGAATGKTLVAAGESSEARVEDVAIGEVWICSGQSNMEWSVNKSWNGDLALAAADRSDLRLLTVYNPGSQEPAERFRGDWKRSDSRTAAVFSAVGYRFGVRLAETLDVPIGLIDNAWGGSACEAWTPRKRLEAAPYFADSMRRVLEIEATRDMEADIAAYQKRLAGWRKRLAKAEAAGGLLPEATKPRGYAIGNKRPGNLYNTRVLPIAGFAVRGVIWYQGESNAGRPGEYRDLFPEMITAWRDLWGRPSMPFYWVQLADYGAEVEAPGESDWAELREAQTATLDRLAATGQAVIIDLGEASDIHPKNKHEVADRLVRWALAKDYGYDIICESPRYESAAFAGSRATVTLRSVAKGLKPIDSKQVQGFAIAGDDRQWRPAQARVAGRNQLEVWSDEIPEPVAVRYAWANNPLCNLYDGSGLPVTPFRTDDW